MKETCLENIITIRFLSLQKTTPKSAFEDLSHGVIPAAMVRFFFPLMTVGITSANYGNSEEQSMTIRSHYSIDYSPNERSLPFMKYLLSISLCTGASCIFLQIFTSIQKEIIFPLISVENKTNRRKITCLGLLRTSQIQAFNLMEIMTKMYSIF